MEYYLMEEEPGNRIPYGINKDRAVDMRKLLKGEYDGIPERNIVQMDLPMETFFPDLLCSPWVMVSRPFMEVIRMYMPKTVYRPVKLWCRETGINHTYYMPFLPELDCMSDQTRYNSIGNRITERVLCREQIRKTPIFMIKGYHEKKCIAARLDLVESLLRREVRGIQLERVRQDMEPVRC